MNVSVQIKTNKRGFSEMCFLFSDNCPGCINMIFFTGILLRSVFKRDISFYLEICILSTWLVNVLGGRGGGHAISIKHQVASVQTHLLRLHCITRNAIAAIRCIIKTISWIFFYFKSACLLKCLELTCTPIRADGSRKTHSGQQMGSYKTAVHFLSNVAHRRICGSEKREAQSVMFCNTL